MEAVTGLALPRGCEAVEYRRVLLPELVLDWQDYPRERLDRRNVDHLLEVLRAGKGWRTPVVVDEELHVLDGWHRLQALREHLDSSLVEVEALVVRCRPEDRLRVAALLNRAHGLRLTDEDAARCAARLASREAAEGGLERALRRWSRELAVPVSLARRAARGLPVRERPRSPALPRRPDLPWDPAGMTPSAAEEAARWLDEALGTRGRLLLADPGCEDALRRLFGRLQHLLAQAPVRGAEAERPPSARPAATAHSGCRAGVRRAE